MLSFNKVRGQDEWIDATLEEHIGRPYILKFEKIKGKEEIELNASNFQIFNDILSDVMKEGTRKLVIDMGNVSRITANALAVLTAKNEEFRARSGEIVLANLTPLMENFLRELHFDTIFRIFGSVEEAVSYF